MEKIVVLTGDPKTDNNLAKCLKMLFPECEIEVRSKQPELKGDHLGKTGAADKGIVDKISDKSMAILS